MIDTLFLVGLAASALRFATPILFAALGETMAQRSGVLNVGLEGIMLVGAFAGMVGAVWTGSPWGGLVVAMACGMALAGLHALFCLTFRVDQILSGIALIVLGTGLSGFGWRLTLGATGTPPKAPPFPRLDLPGLSDLPVVGQILFQHQPMVYLGIALAFALAWFLQRTTWGLEIRAVGENPAAADAAGIGVIARRYGCVLFGGAMAAAGGCYLSVSQVGGFVENMVSGRGFIAIACVVFGQWRPLRVLCAALLFGAAEAAQIRLQLIAPHIPYQLFVMMPYVVAVAALVVVARSTRLPAALGRPFIPDR
ncbi:MAG: ABC transporter permease [Ferrovibrionaceae bacterium]